MENDSRNGKDIELSYYHALDEFEKIKKEIKEGKKENNIETQASMKIINDKIERYEKKIFVHLILYRKRNNIVFAFSIVYNGVEYIKYEDLRTLYPGIDFEYREIMESIIERKKEIVF